MASIEKTLGVNMPSDRLYRLMNHMRTEHSTPEQVGKVARDAGVKRVVLTHIVSGKEGMSDAAYIAGVKQSYTGPVVVGRDLTEF